MARASSEKVGRGLCPSCGAPVTYRKSSGGMLTHKCDNCDSSGYCEPGGDAYKKRMATIAGKTDEDHEKPKVDTPEPEPEAKPDPGGSAKVPEKRGFSLGDV